MSRGSVSLLSTAAGILARRQRLQQDDLRCASWIGVRGNFFRRVAKPAARFSARNSDRRAGCGHPLYFRNQRHSRLRHARICGHDWPDSASAANWFRGDGCCPIHRASGGSAPTYQRSGFLRTEFRREHPLTDGRRMGSSASNLVYPAAPEISNAGKFRSVPGSDYIVYGPCSTDGSTRELEAFSMLQIWSFAFYGLAYVALFAIPIFARKESRLRSGPVLKSAAASGLLLTLLFVGLSIFPIVDVVNPARYAAKTVTVLLGANCIALALFYRQRRRNNSKDTLPDS